jgi:hypothetical protein
MASKRTSLSLLPPEAMVTYGRISTEALTLQPKNLERLKGQLSYRLWSRVHAAWTTRTLVPGPGYQSSGHAGMAAASFPPSKSSRKQYSPAIKQRREFWVVRLQLS